MIHLDLLSTQRVRFLSEIYKDLQKPLPKDQRLDLINKVREILINENDFPEFGEVWQIKNVYYQLLFMLRILFLNLAFRFI